ncbi:16S rRNA (guanine(527)-N(7))-methyltransferase RsmG [candidate division LCP-89 bacterium B3_LCP]|uniref:Ribosomal RNA small subunit methyltransferase G n=1 Tax=candidate division LCP-89 bacterium B3_LCP TaxID=2012998 RepID=A0A532V4K1_UNCL8|nr:MAG: 16S rRNA (guanine(527)-N(7))-methyltransferase RsmG [candidate division LCP-89 bacterium B3_LCP]
MKLDKHKILNLHYVDNPDFYPQCQAYASLLSYWNTIINLVSDRIVDNLFTDLIVQSIYPLSKQIISLDSHVLDVGTGAGLPGIPLKLARPDLKMILLEPRRKKTLFLKRVIEELELKNIEVVRSRLQDFSQKGDQLQNYDLITTRGTGSSLQLFPNMKHLLKPQGKCWFYKGIKGPKEAREISQQKAVSTELMRIDKNMCVIVVGITQGKAIRKNMPTQKEE